MEKEKALALLQIELPDGTVRTEPITQTPFSVGRVAGNDVVLPDPKVSREHARLLVEGDRIQLIDLNSTNGTALGDAQLEPNRPYALSHGEKFQIGRYTLCLQPVPGAEAKEESELPGKTDVIRDAAIESPTAEPPEVAPKADLDRTPAVEPELEPELVPQVRLGVTDAPPPPPPPSEPPSPGEELPPYDHLFGLPANRSRYLRHLPPIYEEYPFLGQFLLVFEGVLTPIEQTVDNFDLYLDPHTAPGFFLSQLARWLGMTLDEKWPEQKRRALIAEAAELYRRRGSRRGLSRHLEIYTEVLPEIIEPIDRPHHFRVVLRPPAGQFIDRTGVERVIEASKPAHTTYELEIVHQDPKDGVS